MNVRVVNNHTQPVMLDNGTQLSASGTEGSERIVGAHELTERDRAAAKRGLFSIQSIQQAEATNSPASDVPASTAPAKTTTAGAEKRSK